MEIVAFLAEIEPLFQACSGCQFSKRNRWIEVHLFQGDMSAGMKYTDLCLMANVCAVISPASPHLSYASRGVLHGAAKWLQSVLPSEEHEKGNWQRRNDLNSYNSIAASLSEEEFTRVGLLDCDK